MEESFRNFTIVSNGPIGFESSRGSEDVEGKRTTKECGTDPRPLPRCIDTGTEPRERKEIATQTISAPRMGKFSTYDDSKLVSFIRKVHPIMEEELSCGMTPLFDHNENPYEPSDRYRVQRHQELTLKSTHEPAGDRHVLTGKSYTAGAAAWLSILTRDAPLLVLACSPAHEAWCDHFASVVTVFRPVRDRYGTSVQWVELCSNPVKSCIESLETNPFNRDIFAGGTVAGDVYLWHFEQERKCSFTELHSETTDCGKVVDMAWTRFNVMSKADHALLSAHSDGTVILWRVGKSVTKDKIFKLASMSASAGQGKAIILTRILATSNSEFVVGCADGSLLLCSTTQLLPLAGSNATGTGQGYGGKSNHFSPATVELKGHSFAVTSLQKIINRRQELLISCDLTGEVFFHDITDTINSTPTLIVKMPLPFKTRIVCTNDAEFIFSPTGNGRLELYRIGSGKVDTIEPSLPLNGTPNLIKMTANGKWLITGTYGGTFIIYSVATDY